MLYEHFNSLTIFQDYVNKIFAKKLNFFTIIYLNNILIYIKYPSLPHIEIFY